MHPLVPDFRGCKFIRAMEQTFSGAFELRIQILATLSQGRACYPSICEEL